MSNKTTSNKKKVKELYKEWNTLSSEVELLLGSNQPGAPLIKNNTVLTAGYSPLALYIAYLYTFAENKIASHKFESPATGQTVYAIEEDATQNCALLRYDGAGFMELTSTYSDPSTIGAIALLNTLATEEQSNQIEDMLQNSIVPSWRQKPDDWKLVRTVTHTLLQTFQQLVEDVFVNNEAEVEIYKAQKPSDLMLDVSCVKSFGKLKNPTDAEEFEKADDEVAQRVLKVPPKAEFKQAMTAIQLMQDDEILDENKLFIPSINEPIFQNRKHLTDWEQDMIDGVVKGIYNNIILYGPAGTGKSTASRTLGLATHLPVYPPIVCDPNTQKRDLVVETIFNDQGVLETIESSLIKAARYGGICEIQEPANVKDSSLMTCLNQLLEPVGYISIPEKNIFIRRHPRCIIMMTTNLDYAGCKPPNESVIDRFQFVKHVIALTADELVKRAETCAEVTMERSFIEIMAQAYIKVCELCVEESFHGAASYRTFLNWVKKTCDCLDPIKAAETTLIDKVNFSTDLDSKDTIRTTISSILQKKKPVIKKPNVCVWADQLAALATLVPKSK